MGSDERETPTDNLSGGDLDTEADLEVVRLPTGSREILIRDGGLKTFTFQDQTVEDLIREGKPFLHMLSEEEVDARRQRPRLIEVGIFDDPGKFWLPNSANKPIEVTRELLHEDADALREEFDLEDDIDEVLPRLPEAVQVVFAHFKATLRGEGRKARARAVRLTGEAYGNGLVQTDTPTRHGGDAMPHFARAGVFSGNGLIVSDAPRGTSAGTRAMRFVVAKGVL